MARWTRKQVEQFAPDDKSVKAALKLARPGPWSETGSTDTLVWGKCQGRGSTPYQVSVDLTGPAAKCSCPSRKFPCKHGLALLFLWVEGDGEIAEAAEASGFAADWVAGRAERAERKAARGDADSEPRDPDAAARRREQRIELMSAGLAEFETWLTDLYRQGLAAARQQPYGFWDDAASRLLDSQLPGLANRVRALPGRLHGRDDWADQVLAETGRWFTALRAWVRRDQLEADDLGNLRAFLGWAVPTADVRAGDPIPGPWVVEGAHRTDDGRLQAQRTWLRNESDGARVVVLDFATGGAVLGMPQVVGSVLTTSVVAYPGSGVRRGLFLDEPASRESRTELGGVDTIEPALVEGAKILAANPFVDQIPAALRAAFVPHGESALVVDRDGRVLPLVEEADPWLILAATGGAEVPIFGELDDGHLRPLTVEVGGELVAV